MSALASNFNWCAAPVKNLSVRIPIILIKADREHELLRVHVSFQLSQLVPFSAKVRISRRNKGFTSSSDRNKILKFGGFNRELLKFPSFIKFSYSEFALVLVWREDKLNHLTCDKNRIKI